MAKNPEKSQTAPTKSLPHIADLKKLSNTPLSMDGVWVIDKQIKKDSDRGAALLAGSLIDYALDTLLDKYEKKRKKTLDDKIKRAHDLSLIGPQVTEDLHLVREIRNVFGHCGADIDFETVEIKAAIDMFNTAWHPAPAKSRDRFILSSHMLTNILISISVSRHPANSRAATN